MVDYLQLMSVPGSNENRATEIAEISRSLKAIAKELHLPVVALSQLNRGVESRENKRGRASDLRDSGSTEQDAGVILMLYSDQLYHPSTGDQNITEATIVKNRHGEMATIRLAFMNNYSKFVTIG